MIKKILILGIIATGSLSLQSCRDTVTEKTVVREVDREEDPEVKVVEEEDNGILERAGEEIDEEVNEEINQEIEKIGDDN